MNLKNKIYIHAAFWLVIIISTSLEMIPALGKLTPELLAGDYFIYLASHLITFYIFYFFTGRKSLQNKNKIILFAAGILILLPASFLFSFLYIWLLPGSIPGLSGSGFNITFLKIFFSIFHSLFLYALAGALLRFTVLWTENEISRKESEKKKISGELKLLRSQINPQFLYHTLNRLKQLVTTKPDDAVSNIDDLSEIMSYILYETSSDKVPLEGEINYIRSYIALQQSRFKPGYISFKTEGEIYNVKVPPMLFMPFLEHVFREVDEDATETPGIKFELNILKSELIFVLSYYFKIFNGNNCNNLFNYSEPIKRYLEYYLQERNVIKSKINGNNFKLILNLKF
ncbi:MAG: histidine kinase [Ignavibacteria bacterium]|nr:histidine kinase [Ignavibacteria bacterium]